MSVDNASSTQKVASKYFSSNSGMDESLSDFQEKKKISALTVTKPKPKTKKVLKRPRGQKDIRTVLKSKKNELVAYAKDFDNICKQAGIDIDSEQLQLAIALSKSVEPSPSDPQTSQLSSQDRTSKIRSTLQEYGFTVPEIKISSTNRRIKKHRKNYKLLLQSEIEKQRNIADKYSQVLLQNINHTSPSSKKPVQCNNSGSKLFYFTTNVPYESIRDNNIYYLKNLPLEKSSSIGSLLRDWSQIPGRPVSPKLGEDFTMDVSEILCSQEEINIMLSGALKTVKNLMRNKLNICTENSERDEEIVNVGEQCDDYISTSSPNVIDDPEIENAGNKSLPNRGISESVRSYSPDMFDDEPSSYHDEGVNKNNHASPENIKSKETAKKSIVLPISLGTKHPFVSSQNQLSQNVTKRKSNDVMELTECIGVHLNPSSSATIRTDTTKRKSDDFMDLTECVAKEKIHIENNIDLTQNSEDKVTEDKIFELKDLTQSSSSNDTLPFVHVSGKNDSLHDTVILDESELNLINRSPGKEDILIEATPVDESYEALCDLTKTPSKKSICVEESSNDSFFEDFMYNHSNSPEQNDTVETSIPHVNEYDCKIDLTQSPEQKDNTIRYSVSEMKNKRKLTESPGQHCYRENAVIEFEDNCKIDLTQSPKKNVNKKEQSFTPVKNNTDIEFTQSTKKQNDSFKSFESGLNDNDHVEMDLTQNSSGTEDVSTNNLLENKIELFNKSSLGKQGDVSIDYDELCTTNASSINKSNICNKSDEINTKETNSYCINTPTISSDENSGNIELIHTSQESEVFEISDKELNYSMHKNRYEDCFEVNFGGISVVDSNRSNRSSNLENRDANQSTSDSFLPKVNVIRSKLPKEFHNYGISPIKNDAINNIIETSSNSESAIKKNAIYDVVKTPSNREYVIKTDQVTPMGDYMAMSTPERNKELEKYGLKPLKRKRAIQLLTHIYNQTHPMVEPCTAEVESPTKKRKTEPSQPLISPIKSPRKNTVTKEASKSPRKKIGTQHTGGNEKSPTKNSNSKKNMSPINDTEIIYEIKENIYKVTNEKVEIKNIECGEDEWVFQKREKAKLHSCRVPLHIAFHNYVSCRRGLREAILRYEPVEIDVIHKDLAASGHKYDPKDLLKFLDKKCITVKTVDKIPRNNRK